MTAKMRHAIHEPNWTRPEDQVLFGGDEQRLPHCILPDLRSEEKSQHTAITAKLHLFRISPFRRVLVLASAGWCIICRVVDEYLRLPHRFHPAADRIAM
jgi:hypothetical protein